MLRTESDDNLDILTEKIEKDDLIVIGGGTAGLLASDFGVKLGVKISQVEQIKSVENVHGQDV